MAGSNSMAGGSGCGSGSSSLAGVTWPSAISRSATTVGLSFSQSTMGSAPFASRRARLAASSTSWNRLSTFCRQSSTVMRAMTGADPGELNGREVYRKTPLICQLIQKLARALSDLRAGAFERLPTALDNRFQVRQGLLEKIVHHDVFEVPPMG